VKCANDGRAAARKRGVHMGRKPKLTELRRRVARERIAKGESARAIAREWGVAHTTVARYYRLHVSKRLLGQHDGPMLEALQRLNGGTIHLPGRIKDRPDRDRPAQRFERFKMVA
jgi:DNA invertase Pin-like site-specific DNA recombinase